jgi:type 1 glutamine amidotransferase
MKSNGILLALALSLATVAAADKKIVLLAGSPSHGVGEHEYRAGCLLLQKCLADVPRLTTVVVSNDWPSDAGVLDGADAVFMFCTGGDAHPALKPERRKILADLMARGVGFGTCHYGVEIPKENGGAEFLAWQGGYFETFWSVNPHWDADFKAFPDHPVARGVKPFKVNDEWYYHMRFPEGMKGVTPILTAVPPDPTRGRDGVNDPHGGNPEVQKHKGEPEHVMWVYERPEGGRGFGITGAHYHRNWANDNFRKVVLNALLWIARIEVPANGVESTVTPAEMRQNWDVKKKLVLVAGKQSHGPGDHEFRAGCLLLQKCLADVPGLQTFVYSNGWPQDSAAFKDASAVVIYADGGAGHPAIQGDHKATLDGLAKKNVGLGFMHYGVEIPSTNGGAEMIEWAGGYYEHLYSVNPKWAPRFEKFPNHPVARGVQPFSNFDEWYFNIRWGEDRKGVTPILTAIPSDEVRQGPYVYPKGPYPHIVEASGREETMMWVFQRPGRDGGRSFGFTGGHTHAHWGNDQQRKAVLNAMLWIAKMEVPANGMDSTVSPDDLASNLDPKKKK